MGNERDDLTTRADILRAYLAVLEDPEKLLRVCAGVPGDADDARDAVASAFGVGEIAAMAILDLQVRRFTPRAIEQIRSELADHERRLAESDPG
ncbi:MAG: hypothetical protein PIR02_04115 [Microbacterium enclense]